MNTLKDEICNIFLMGEAVKEGASMKREGKVLVTLNHSETHPHLAHVQAGEDENITTFTVLMHAMMIGEVA
jgi:hypothetical protein